MNTIVVISLIAVLVVFREPINDFLNKITGKVKDKTEVIIQRIKDKLDQ